MPTTFAVTETFGPEETSLATPFERVVRARRSIRVYDGKPVPEAIVNKCLDLALCAPSSSNLQPWEFHWIRTPELRAKIVEACLDQPSAKTAGELIVCVARTKMWKRRAQQNLDAFADREQKGTKIPKAAKDYYLRIVPFMNRQGVLNWFGIWKKIAMSVVGMFRPAPREPASHADMRVWATKSTALACENLMLAFRAHGYDSCPMEGIDSARVRKALGLPCDSLVTMVVSAGRRKAEGVYGPQIRFDRGEFVFER